MEIFLHLWKAEFGFRVLSLSWDRPALTWFWLLIRWGTHKASIDIYHPRTGGLRFHIALPLISLANDVVERAVETDTGYRRKPVISGKVFGLRRLRDGS